MQSRFSITVFVVADAIAGQAGIELQPQHLPHDPCGILRTRGRLNHSLFLRSAYAEAEGREPEFTNYTGECRAACGITANSHIGTQSQATLRAAWIIFG